MINADTCGYANYNYERIAGGTRCGELSRNGMDTIDHSKGYTSCKSTDNHDRHVGIKSVISVLMEFDISRSRKPGHRAS